MVRNNRRIEILIDTEILDEVSFRALLQNIRNELQINKSSKKYTNQVITITDLFFKVENEIFKQGVDINVEAPQEAPVEPPQEEPTEAPLEEPTEAPVEPPLEEPTESQGSTTKEPSVEVTEVTQAQQLSESQKKVARRLATTLKKGLNLYIHKNVDYFLKFRNQEKMPSLNRESKDKLLELKFNYFEDFFTKERLIEYQDVFIIHPPVAECGHPNLWERESSFIRYLWEHVHIVNIVK